MNNKNKPEWYNEVIDIYPSTGEELDNRDSIINMGSPIPKTSKSKSSVYHDTAVINNSFNKDSIEQTLFDMHNNSYHKLMASNNDNVHFYKWEGHMSDLNLDKITNKCTFTLPWDLFIYPGERDSFKLSNFYNKWIKIQDILNNWDIFKWNILVFINHRVHSEYEIYIQEQEVLIRFDYNKVWGRNNYPVYIYKFDTNFQKRILISKELLYNQWNWQIPYSYIGDMKIKNNSKIIASINKISDLNIRTDNNTYVDILGDNLEFLTIDPNKNTIDFSTISQINVDYINSESSQYIWLSLFVPKFMHEYPKFLVTDILFRPYLPRLRPITVLEQSIPKNAKGELEEDYISRSENIRQLFIDENPNAFKDYDGWVNVIRPIVLSDAYTNHIEPYDVLRPEIDSFRLVISIFADTINKFKYYIANDNTKNEENWNNWINLINTHCNDMYDAQYSFLHKRLSPQNKITQDAKKLFSSHIELMRGDAWINTYVPNRFYSNCNTLIQECIKLSNKYHIADIVRNISRKELWSSPTKYQNQVRFHRPIATNNFWCFEYNNNDKVWRPTAKNITQHFPDVYFINPLENESMKSDGVYKAFFFYSDTINPRNLLSDVKGSSPIYDEDLLQYENDIGSYHNIFMEKFYWMALNSIYKGLLITDSKWEVLEYVIDNPSYVRFNDLFINTMEPYYKLGLSTYLKGDDNGFPFDYIVNKMKEAMKLKWNDYDKITNFETYLHNQWVPSYFDYITKILDDVELNNRIVERPPLSFNIHMLKKFILKISNQSVVNELLPIVNDCIFDEEIYSLKQLNKIISILLDYNDDELLVNSIINYIELANIQHIPEDLPDYTDIYETEGLNVVSPGIGYINGDTVYIPKVGVYNINNDSDLSVDDSYYQKTFTNPLNENNHLTRGSMGIGLSVKVESVNKSSILINSVIQPTIEFINEIINALVLTSINANPLENNRISAILMKVENIINKWDLILEKYGSNISQSNINLANIIITKLPVLNTYGNTLIDIRNSIDLRDLLKHFNNLIETVIHYKYDSNWSNPLLISLETQANITYRQLYDYYAKGSSWKDTDNLLDVILNANDCSERYKSIISDEPESNQKNDVLNILINLSNSIELVNLSIESFIVHTSTLDALANEFKDLIESLIFDNDSYYSIHETTIALPGYDYHIGEIVIVNVDDIKLCFQITSTDNVGVASVKPLMNYALTKKIWGVFETTSAEGSGVGLKLDVKTQLVKPDLLINSDDYYIDAPDQYDDGELITFKFPNIYDIDMGYEVFVGGKQITDFYQRHEDDHYLKSRKVDTIYINANKVNNLKNSSIYITGDQYFIYRINSIEIRDPGAGYHNDQEIFVDLNSFYLKLLVTKLMSDPFKGIDEINLIDGGLIYERNNPSGESLLVVNDDQNNIDDEFHVSDYDKLTNDNRNETFMYPDVNMIYPLPEPPCDNGDPETNLYQGSRIDNSATGDISDRWNSISDILEMTHPFIDDTKRIPPGQPLKGEYQLIKQLLFHNYESLPYADFSFPNFINRPASSISFKQASIGKTIAIETDETKDGHRCIYTIIGISMIGQIIYNEGVYADKSWNSIHVNWMNTDWHPGIPNLRQQYPDAPWMTSLTYDQIRSGINNKRWDQINAPRIINNTTYIHNLTINDISVFNWTTKEWEDLSDISKWNLDVLTGDEWGFTLTYLSNEIYSYDMQIYLNKVPDTQMRNSELVRNAKIDIYASITDEVDITPARLNVNTGRSVRIRKIFPYKQIENYIVNEHNQSEGMLFKLKPYMHYRNEIHLEDIKLFNRDTELFEDITDTDRFEIMYRNITYEEKNKEVIDQDDIRVIKDSNLSIIDNDDVLIKNNDGGNSIPLIDSNRIRIVNEPSDIIFNGSETNTKLTSSSIIDPGDGYYNGSAWAYNDELNIQIFCDITTNSYSNITSFKLRHIPKMPPEGNYEFTIYQHDYIGTDSAAKLYAEFRTEDVEMYDDGWIHNITNKMAVPPKGEFKIIPKYSIIGDNNYDIIVDKTPYSWRFENDEWLMKPVFRLPDHQIPQDRFYLLLNNIRFPMINCSTGKPTLDIKETEIGTDVTFLNMYRRNEQLELRTLPYPTRSVYIQRNIPKHGYINLEGKLNKPLDKKRFEFWVNGKLLYGEVTIITPTKIFLHGLTSLKNLEILEINRTQDEFFSDEFLYVSHDELRPHPQWDYNTYLDDSLKGTFEDDNYSLDEQEKLLSPIWRQVQRNHPEYKNYPENVDTDRDILLRLYTPEDLPLPSDLETSYEYMVLNAPTLEGIPLTGRSMQWKQFKWKPMDDIDIINELNEEWKHEITTNPYLNTHVIINKNEWYGMAVRLYDKYGILTHNLNEALYKVYDPNIISISDASHTINIIKNVIEIDLD